MKSKNNKTTLELLNYLQRNMPEAPADESEDLEVEMEEDEDAEELTLLNRKRPSRRVYS